ncbi:MAG: type 4a pilus biogenesis protein PilO [Candidatus Tantalella remota]|nr:type 4a pilus biogenesis protein PilO [Candidatus Tantalella remota]
MIDLKNIDFSFEDIKDFFEDEQKRLYTIVGVVLTVSILYLAFVVFPKFNSLSKVTRTVTELNNNISLVNTRMKRLNEMTARLEELRKEQAVYSVQLPAEKEIPAFLEELAVIAKKSDVKIISVTPHGFSGGSSAAKDKKGKVKQYYYALPVEISAQSGYHQLGQFVNDLEEGQRFITVEDLKIQNDKNSPRKHNVKLVLKTYVSVENEKK